MIGCAKRLLSILVALVLTAVPVSAFDTLAADFAFSNLQRELLDRRNGQARAADLETPDAQAAVSFTSDPARTQANLRTFIERTPDPRGRAELKTIIDNQPSIIADIGQAMRSRYALDPHSVADAYAVWWIGTWQAVNRRTDEPDRKTIQAVRRQVHAALLNTPDFLETTDADRQQLTEALLMQTLMISEIARLAEGNPGLQGQLAARAEQAALNSGLAVAEMTLTPDGFELR